MVRERAFVLVAGVVDDAIQGPETRYRYGNRPQTISRKSQGFLVSKYWTVMSFNLTIRCYEYSA
jgi:hypothetical protein